jgi:PIN domain nuclease of toxin-antitoxin system
MAVLLDTHAFLWWCEDAPELSRKARKAIANEDCRVSLASFWEIAVKLSLRKLRLPSSFERYVPEQMAANAFSFLEIGFRHVSRCAALPWHHRDPFDRLLVAQALEEDWALVSRDEILERYGARRIW